jgi:RNA polymerase sigma factor (sigma-70 family)
MHHSVVIIDDDYRIRHLMSKSISTSGKLKLKGTAEDFSQGKILVDRVTPDVALVDLGLPDKSGVDLIRYISTCIPSCSCMVISNFSDEEQVIKSIEAGAKGYLLKSASTKDINEQIDQVVTGGSPISPKIARMLLNRFVTPIVASSETDLSERELLVLQLSAKGYTYQEIAKIITVSHYTVSTYVKRLYKKLQVHSKSEAVFEAQCRGISIK